MPVQETMRLAMADIAGSVREALLAWPSARDWRLGSADLFGQGDDDSGGAAEVAE